MKLIFERIQRGMDDHPVVAMSVGMVGLAAMVVLPLAVYNNRPEAEAWRQSIAVAVADDGFDAVQYIVPNTGENGSTTASVWIGTCEIDKVTLTVRDGDTPDVLAYKTKQDSQAARRGVIPNVPLEFSDARSMLGVIAAENCR